LNICMTHYAFYPTTGGVETHLLDLCAELVRQGNTVHALMGSMPGQPEESEIEGIHVHRVDWMNPEILRERKEAAQVAVDEVWLSLQAEIKENYRRFIKDYEIDVVHAHNFHHFLPEYGMALTEIRREDGIPTFLTIHEMWGEFLCRDLLDRTEWDRIIAVGQHVYGDMVAAVRNSGNVEVVLHGVNTDMFHTGLDGERLRRELGLVGRRVILHPARLLPWKGVHTTVEAFREIAERFPDVSLVITDTREILDWIHELEGYRERIFAMLAEYNLQERVVMRQFDFFKELPQAYGMADIVVYPTSGEEPFGLVPLEAMASGKPIVVTRSGGLIESVVDGVTGFVIPKEDPALLANRLSALLERPQLARRMGQAGRRHVEERFTRRRMALEVEALYQAAGNVMAAAGSSWAAALPRMTSREA
jgi:glycosyltransferase involved in cell wall biosynthesis